MSGVETWSHRGRPRRRRIWATIALAAAGGLVGGLAVLRTGTQEPALVYVGIVGGVGVAILARGVGLGAMLVALPFLEGILEMGWSDMSRLVSNPYLLLLCLLPLGVAIWLRRLHQEGRLGDLMADPPLGLIFAAGLYFGAIGPCTVGVLLVTPVGWGLLVGLALIVFSPPVLPREPVVVR
jgi:hypothetical protein